MKASRTTSRLTGRKSSSGNQTFHLHDSSNPLGRRGRVTSWTGGGAFWVLEEGRESSALLFHSLDLELVAKHSSVSCRELITRREGENRKRSDSLALRDLGDEVDDTARVAPPAKGGYELQSVWEAMQGRGRTRCRTS